MRAHVCRTWQDVHPAGWDALAEGHPFVQHGFLATIERCGDTARGDWLPRPVVVTDEDGHMVAGAPAWVRRSSMGEFVYDFAFADAAERAGLAWYPKLVVGVPFTPVTGPRLLGHGCALPVLLAGLDEAARGCAGQHVLFPTAEVVKRLAPDGWAPRVQQQYHWRNEGWPDFEAWLRDAHTSADRCEIRRERRRAVSGLRVHVDDDPSPELLRAVGSLWARSLGRFGPWGNAWIAPNTLAELATSWPGNMQVIGAWDGRRLVAAVWNVRGPDRLYGRVWAPAEERRFLHFEMCLYQGIQWCLEHGRSAFEPGHGGEHKRARGFQPTRTWSAHRIAHAGLHRAVAEWFAREAERY
jgi:predicted N-acyltransferase